MRERSQVGVFAFSVVVAICICFGYSALAGEQPADDPGEIPVFHVLGTPPCAPGFELVGEPEPGYILRYNPNVARWITEADVDAALVDPESGDPAPEIVSDHVLRNMEPATRISCRWRPVRVVEPADAPRVPVEGARAAQ